MATGASWDAVIRKLFRWMSGDKIGDKYKQTKKDLSHSFEMTNSHRLSFRAKREIFPMTGRNIQSIMSEYDVIVVGSGLAGLTAGLFSSRHGLSTLILESNIPGGHLISIEKIDDFPGFPDGIAGYDLCPTVQRQAADHGAEFERAEVVKLEAKDRFWSVETDEQSHLTKAVIVATGS